MEYIEFKKSMRNVFDETGMFKNNFWYTNNYELIFNDDGNVIWDVKENLDKFIDDNNFNYKSDAVKLYHSQIVNNVTHGNYSDSVLWR